MRAIYRRYFYLLSWIFPLPFLDHKSPRLNACSSRAAVLDFGWVNNFRCWPSTYMTRSRFDDDEIRRRPTSAFRNSTSHGQGGGHGPTQRRVKKKRSCRTESRSLRFESRYLPQSAGRVPRTACVKQHARSCNCVDRVKSVESSGVAEGPECTRSFQMTWQQWPRRAIYNCTVVTLFLARVNLFAPRAPAVVAM